MIGIYPDVAFEKIRIFKDGRELQPIAFADLKGAYSGFSRALDTLKSQKNPYDNTLFIDMDNGESVELDIFDLEDIISQLKNLLPYTHTN